MRLLLAPVLLTTLITTAGCYHSAERAGDNAVARGDHKAAADSYTIALKSGELLSWEIDRIKQKLGESGDTLVREGMAKAERAASPDDRVVELAALRATVRSTGIARDADEALLTKMRTEAERAFAALTASAGAAPYLPRVRRGERVASPFTKSEPVWPKLGQLRSEGAAHHTKLTTEAAQIGKDAAGSVVLHSALATRFGGSPVAARDEAMRAITEGADIVWSTSVEGSACGNQAHTIAKSFPPSTVGRPANAAIRVDECQPTSKTWDTTESYSYTEKVAYQEQERYQAGYTTETATDYRAEQVCTRGPPRYVGKTEIPNQECHTEQRPYTVTKQVPRYEWRTVTKYRDEPRTGSRTVTHVRHEFRVRGSAVLTLAGDTKTVDISESAEAEDTSYTSPHGSKKLGSDVNAGAVESKALRAAYGRLGPTQRAFAESIALEHLTRAKQAEAESRFAIAEGAYVVATRATGTPSPQATSFLGTRYGLEPADIVAVAQGGTPAETKTETPALEPVTTDRATNFPASPTPRGRTAAQEIFAFWLLGGTASTTNILNQPDRAGVTGGFAFGFGLLNHAMSSAWGIGVHDEAWLEVQAGGRTSEGVGYNDGKGEDPYATRFRASYTLLLGYRGERIGLFAGARAGYFGLRTGDASTSGTYIPLVGRAELRLGGPAVVVVQGWALNLAGSGEARGASLDVPLTRETFYLRAQIEQWRVDTTVLDAAKNEVSAARQLSLVTNFGVGFLY